MSDILITREGDVLVFTLNRPDRLNPLSPAMREDLLTTLRDELATPKARAIVITGAGRGFCTGADLDLSTIMERRPLIETQMINGINQVIHLLRTIPVPVIAAVNGPAAGAGFGIALAADIMIVADSASFYLSFAKIGASPDGGCVATLCRKIGEARATALAMLGEKMDAQQAYDLGVAHQMVPTADCLPTAMELAQKLAKGPTTSYGLIKQQVAAAAASSLDDSLRLEASCQYRAFNSHDFEEGVTAFVEKRSPKFLGR